MRRAPSRASSIGSGLTGALDFVRRLSKRRLEHYQGAVQEPGRAANDVGEGRVQVHEAAFAIVRPTEAGKIKIPAVTNTARTPASPRCRRSGRPAFPRSRSMVWSDCLDHSGMPLDLRERITADFKASADLIVEDRLTAPVS